jgi:hypothetical protein
MHGINKKCIYFVQQTLGKCMHRWKDNMDLQETRSEEVHWIQLAYDKVLYKHPDEYLSSVKAWTSIHTKWVIINFPRKIWQ